MRHTPVNLGDLRARAERAIARGQTLAGDSPDNTDDLALGQLLEELRIYQAELEIQNLELNEAQVKLAQALSKYQTLYETLPLPALLVDELGFVVEFNQQAIEQLRLSGLHTLNRPSVYQLFEPEGRTALYALPQAPKPDTPRRLEALWLKQDRGHARLIDVHVIHHATMDGQEARHLLVLVDKSDELALRESELRFRSFTDTRMTLLRATDANHQPEHFNQGWLDFVGLDLERALTGDVWRTRLHPDEAARVLDTCANCRDQRQPFRMDYRLRHRDGQYRWIRDEGMPRQDSAGRFIGYVHHCQDITDLIEARQALDQLSGELQLKEERLRLALDATREGLWDWNVETGATYCNPAYFEMLGYEPDDLAPNADSLWVALLHPDEREATLTAARERLRDEGWYELEFRLRTKDGGYRWINSRGKVVGRDPAGQPLRAIGTHTDITERKQAEEQLRELNANLEEKVAERTAQLARASQAKSEFLANMSHEIRTPMNAILGLTQLLERETLTADQRDMLHKIATAGGNLLHIINDILDFSKIEAGQLKVEAYPFDLCGVLNDLDSVLGVTAREKGLTLTFRGCAELSGALLGDPLRIKQVLINLVGNAIKFTERGEVAITVEPLAVSAATARFRFKVSDQGIGIRPEALAGLFQPFTQADTGTTRRFGGTGLGLSISKRLVELMGGTIGADSVPGQGSTFWFELPFERVLTESTVTAEPPRAPPTPPRGPRLQGHRVLAVDDNRINLFMLERALKREGASVMLAADGQQALQTLRASPQAFDVVLMDIQMPVLDGLGATREIRADAQLANLPIIALTAGVLTEEREAAIAAGMNDFLAKPVDLETMIQTLELHSRAVAQ